MTTLKLTAALVAGLLLLTAGMAIGSTYTVQQGDTLYSLAGLFHTTVANLAVANKISADSKLVIGQVLTVPDQPSSAQATQPIQATHQTTTPTTHVGWLGVTTTKVNLRHSPGSGQVLFVAPRSTNLVVQLESGTYYGVLMVDGSIGWLPKRYLTLKAVELVSQTPPARPTGIQLPSRGWAAGSGQLEIVREAFTYLGIPYKYGGKLPNNVDCSLLVQTVFARFGWALPRTAAAQFEVGYPIPPNEMLPGDRIYFADKDGRINHAGIYIGGGQFIHASSRRGCVALDDFSVNSYARTFAGARRP